MESIAERALSYARMADCRDRREMELAKFDYIAGAKEERLLVVEWLERNAPQVVARFKQTSASNCQSIMAMMIQEQNNND